jgi:hypothetical protein
MELATFHAPLTVDPSSWSRTSGSHACRPNNFHNTSAHCPRGLLRLPQGSSIGRPSSQIGSWRRPAKLYYIPAVILRHGCPHLSCLHSLSRHSNSIPAADRSMPSWSTQSASTNVRQLRGLLPNGPTQSNGSSRSKAPRAALACDTCRLRKTRCLRLGDGCERCSHFNKECTYSRPGTMSTDHPRLKRYRAAGAAAPDLSDSDKKDTAVSRASHCSSAPSFDFNSPLGPVSYPGSADVHQSFTPHVPRPDSRGSAFVSGVTQPAEWWMPKPQSGVSMHDDPTNQAVTHTYHIAHDALSSRASVLHHPAWPVQFEKHTGISPAYSDSHEDV